MNAYFSAYHDHRKSLDLVLKLQQEIDSDTFTSDKLNHNHSNNVKHRRVVDMASRNHRNISKADEEIEKFEKEFVWPLETSFDDSGYDPGSIVGDMDSEVNDPPTNQDLQNGRESIKDFDQVFQYENISVISSSQVNSSPYIQQRLPSPTISLSTASDCDSGSFSRCSTPYTLSNRNTAQAKLVSTPRTKIDSNLLL